MAIKKEISLKTNGVESGYVAEYLIVQHPTITKNGVYTIEGDLRLFKSKEIRDLNINSFMDNFKFSYVVSQEEAFGNIVATAYRKIKESVLDENGVETNVLQGNAGRIGFQDAVDLI